MGCRCCKLIQSYLLDPVQAPSPAYVAELTSRGPAECIVPNPKAPQSGGTQGHKSQLYIEEPASTDIQEEEPSPPGEVQLSWVPAAPEEATGTEDWTEEATNGIGLCLGGLPGGDPSHSPAGSPTNRDSPTVGQGQPGANLEGYSGPRVLSGAQSPQPGTSQTRGEDVSGHDAGPLPAADPPGASLSADGRPEGSFDWPRLASGPATLPMVGDHFSGRPSARSGRQNSPGEVVEAEVVMVSLSTEGPSRAGRGQWERAGMGEEEDDVAVAEALAALEAATAGEEVGMDKE
ncbi:uncharacterized protein C4orf19 homolog [Ornithorhynchus anatinus]|uniref:uncharacterized protein C4orf19 homolog n=1 Tax=Ornithorhynchus anatinus TaxID=9258 RepID=UPI0010A7B52D|nr:uncharacterized protein C4orf19 homolog [Ornithorhynchus anatinus]XP_028938833.1 uncharacterized protein C4orf19 homolog [Ornithorhynchus anatinus]